MTVDEYTLISDLFGKTRSEARPPSTTTSTIMGVAVSNSANGSVDVELPGNVTGGEGNVVTLPTEAHIVKGDVVSVTLVGGVAKAARVTGTVGGGDRTYEYAASAERAAAEAWQHADEAADAADAAQDSADAASESSRKAFAYLLEVEDDWEAIEGYRESSEKTLVQIEQDAADAKDAAEDAQEAAEDAQEAAGVAQEAAEDAQESADIAGRAANGALNSLSFVEDVAGTLQWIQDNCTFAATSDTTVQDGKVYFTYDSTTQDYSPIAVPDADANPHALGWYEITDIEQTQRDFIMAHLCVTGRGLWVLPSGIGSSTTPASGESQDDSDARQGSGYKLLLSNNGTYIYDSLGNLVITYGANIVPSTDRPFYIGDTSSQSYILYTPASGSTPAKISIGGAVDIGGSKTISELLAAYDTAALRVKIASSAGTGFRNQQGSTILTARVFQYGDNELDSAGTVFSYLWNTGATTKSITVNAPATTATYSCEVTI